MADEGNIIYDDEGRARQFRYTQGDTGGAALSGATTAQEAARNFLRANASVLAVAAAMRGSI